MILDSKPKFEFIENSKKQKKEKKLRDKSNELPKYREIISQNKKKDIITVLFGIN